MKTGLILEGGAMRGMYTAGVLDVMMENNIWVDGAVGVSAGAVFGCNYKSKQIGRTIRYNKKYGRDPRYAGFHSLLKTGDYFGTEFCYHEIPERLDPFDTETFEKNPVEFYVVGTDVTTGKAVYHKCTNGKDKDLEWFRASASMPLLSNIVEVDGYRLLDGGIADSIPGSSRFALLHPMYSHHLHVSHKMLRCLLTFHSHLSYFSSYLVCILHPGMKVHLPPEYYLLLPTHLCFQCNFLLNLVPMLSRS